jgi:membrane associated rhomboid family serine protease
MPPIPPITQALLLINVAFFCIYQLMGGLLLGAMALRPWGSGFMPWQPITYAFLHAETFHLFFNMMGLWMFGTELERLWGGKRFLHFYMASVLTAAAAQLLVAALMSSANPTIGASGGLFGLLMAYGMLFPNRIIMPLFPPIPMRARTFVAVFGAIELVMGYFNPAGGVAHFAHLGGMLGGFLMIRYWRGEPPFGGLR